MTLAPYVPAQFPCKALLPRTAHKSCLLLTCIVFNSQRTRPDKRNKPISHKRLNSPEGTPSSASHLSTTHRSASTRLGFARGRKTISQPPSSCQSYHQTRPVSTPVSNLLSGLMPSKRIPGYFRTTVRIRSNGIAYRG